MLRFHPHASFRVYVLDITIVVTWKNPLAIQTHEIWLTNKYGKVQCVLIYELYILELIMQFAFSFAYTKRENNEFGTQKSLLKCCYLSLWFSFSPVCRLVSRTVLTVRFLRNYFDVEIQIWWDPKFKLNLMGIHVLVSEKPFINVFQLTDINIIVKIRII